MLTKMDMRFTDRKYAIGAEVARMGGVHFRVWAPKPSRISLVLETGQQGTVEYPLIREEDGYWSCHVPEAKSGMLYRYRPDGQENMFPDPLRAFSRKARTALRRSLIRAPFPGVTDTGRVYPGTAV